MERSKKTNISVNINTTLKQEVTKLCEELGLKPSVAITIFLKQFVRNQGFPFKIKNKQISTDNNDIKEKSTPKLDIDSIDHKNSKNQLKDSNNNVNLNDFNLQTNLDQTITDQSAWHQFSMAFDPIIVYFLTHSKKQIDLLKLVNHKIDSFNKDVFKNSKQADHWVIIVNNFSSKQLLNKVLETFHLKLISQEDDFTQSWSVAYI